MLQTLNFVGARQIDAKATFFRYQTCNAGGLDTSIRLKADGNDLGVFIQGDSIELPIACRRWEIVPVTPACVGTVRLGLGRITSGQLSGVVEIVDGGRTRTASGVAGVGTVAQGPLAANFSAVQLWNPAGSVYNVYVRRVLLSSPGAATAALIRAMNSALSTLEGTVTSKRLYNQTLPGLELRRESMAALPGGAIMTANFPAGSSLAYETQEPLMMPPGSGIAAVSGGLNQDIRATFDCFIEPV